MLWISEILAKNLLIVFLLELPLAFLLGARTLKKFSSVALANIITNPPVVLCALITTLFFGKWEALVILILEISAVVTEGFIFSKYRIFEKKNPYLISLCLNLVSYLAGEIIEKLI